ncbi:MBOAT family O-acyltransferase [Candidatus Electronema sp. PJ]|uniref:MBOAT family O-acyltransferase n=1 Tax=Candidatus Electronema sp. PJ TaxID=3401572 RepID=UPI003AA870DA
MLFNSSLYIVFFLPCVIAGYFLLNHWRFVTAATVWLVLASLFFYGYGSASSLPLITASIVVNFAFGSSLRRQGNKSRRLILAFGILFNLGLLGYYKYALFFLENVNLLGASFPLPHLALPLAISFFTFQQIAYLVDCSREQVGNHNFFSYCLFVTFFPLLSAGPISRHHELMPQFSRLRNRVFSSRNTALGIIFFSLGLFKKVWIADQFAGWAGAGFAAKTLTFFDAWGTAFSYTFQLYFDFSGYTDMAIGSALFFNIVLPINFDSPYQATSIQEFWRRWHITLSRWLRDYLYIPLGGSRQGQYKTCLNLLLTFLLAGLWHGAGWTFVLWGLLHGTALVVHRLWKGLGLRMPALLGWLCTFLFISTSWVIFRATNLEEGLRVLKGMAGLNGVTFSARMAGLLHHIGLLDWLGTTGTLLLPGQMRWYLLLFGLVLFFLPNSCQIGGLQGTFSTEEKGNQQGNRLRQTLFHFQPNCYWALVSGIMFSMALYRLVQIAPSAFLYFNF